MIRIENVTKQFGKAVVLEHISMNIERGSIRGLVGRNGCGKSMLLKCICGMIPVSEGEIFCEGKRIGKDIEQPDSYGALIEGPGFREDFSGLWNLKYLFSLKGKPDIVYLKEVMRRVGLDPDNKLRVGKYSMGMKGRLGIAQAVMEKPRLLLLDEPMNGLDNAGAAEMRNLLKELNRDGATIVISSHIPEDIYALCHRITYLDNGRVVNEKDNKPVVSP